jgi:hypothetical protein
LVVRVRRRQLNRAAIETEVWGRAKHPTVQAEVESWTELGVTQSP